MSRHFYFFCQSFLPRTKIYHWLTLPQTIIDFNKRVGRFLTCAGFIICGGQFSSQSGGCFGRPRLLYSSLRQDFTRSLCHAKNAMSFRRGSSRSHLQTFSRLAVDESACQYQWFSRNLLRLLFLPKTAVAFPSATIYNILRCFCNASAKFLTACCTTINSILLACFFFRAHTLSHALRRVRAILRSSERE